MGATALKINTKTMPVPSNPEVGRHFYTEAGEKLQLDDYMAKKIELTKNGTVDSNRLTDLQFDRENEGGAIFNGRGLSMDEQRSFRPEGREIGGGGWVCVIKPPGVDERFRPVKYNVYWAIPYSMSKNYDGYDQYGRYKVELLMKDSLDSAMYEKVCLFPHEYVVFKQEDLDMCVAEGELTLQVVGLQSNDEPMNMELLQEKLKLTPDERDIIDSMMLDGLDEIYACQEYFYTKHIDVNNRNIFYAPTQELKRILTNQFG